MTRLWTAAAGLSLALLQAACEGPAADSDFVQTDSAGIAILESFRPAWEEGRGWTIADEPELAIGAGPAGSDDPNHPSFGRIRKVSVLSSGSLVVGDISTSEVMVFDSLGRLTHKFGGRGEGPGELEDFGGADTCGGDTGSSRGRTTPSWGATRSHARPPDTPIRMADSFGMSRGLRPSPPSG